MKFIDKLIKDKEEREKIKQEKFDEEIKRILENIDSRCEDAHKKGKENIEYDLTQSLQNEFKYEKIENCIIKILEDKKITTSTYKYGPLTTLKISWLDLLR